MQSALDALFNQATTAYTQSASQLSSTGDYAFA